MTPTAAPARTPWANRIVDSGEEAPDQLLANPANWRIHPSAQQEALAGVLDQVGWVQQVLVNRRTGHVVDGHLRVALAIKQEALTVPVLYVDLEPEEEALVLASLDPLAAMASTDYPKLRALLADVTVDSKALAAMLKELAPKDRSGGTDPDDIPELPAEPTVRPGELWILGDHRLLCGDATSPEDVGRLLDGATPTLLATDPPYGVSLDPSWRDGVYNGLGPAEKPYMQLDGQGGDDSAPEAPVAPRARNKGFRNKTLSGDTRADWSEAYALVPSITVGYVWHAALHARAVAEGLERIGFDIVAQIIWDKGLFAMSRSWYHWAHEPCWVIRRSGGKGRFLGKHDQGTIWRAPSPKMIMGGSKEEREDHPAQKPVVLAEWPIENHLRTGEAVYDPFCGSGTTLIAAERLGRRCFGMEIDPRYAQIIIERWERFTGREAVRG